MITISNANRGCSTILYLPSSGQDCASSQLQNSNLHEIILIYVFVFVHCLLVFVLFFVCVSFVQYFCQLVFDSRCALRWFSSRVLIFLLNPSWDKKIEVLCCIFLLLWGFSSKEIALCDLDNVENSQILSKIAKILIKEKDFCYFR